MPGPGSEEIVDTADTVGEIFVDVVGVADTPDLATENATGDEDTAIPLNIDASLIDVDGSETLSIVITGVPEGRIAQYRHPRHGDRHLDSDSRSTRRPDDHAAAWGRRKTFDLMVTATTTENDAGTEFDEFGNDVGIDSVALPLHVNVLDVADQPTLVLA